MPGLQRIRLQGTDGSAQQGHADDSNDAHLLMDAIPDPFVQNLFVLCHGEELISPDVNVQAEARPCDPPLTLRGKQQAWRVGRKIMLDDWNVTRVVVVSPFLRCVQTAVEVMAGLCSMPSLWDGGQGLPSSTSTIKASIECGLEETLPNKQSTLPYCFEVEKKWFQPCTSEVTELSSILPIEMIRCLSFHPSKQKEQEKARSAEDMKCNYISIFKMIANIYPYENIVYVTHAEGVKQAISMMWPRTEVNLVTYCAYAHAQRPIFEHDYGDWELLSESSPSILLDQYI